MAMMAGEDGTSADGGQGEEEVDEDDKADPDAEGVAKMRASEIKAELDMRGVGYTGIFEKVYTEYFLCNGGEWGLAVLARCARH